MQLFLCSIILCAHLLVGNGHTNMPYTPDQLAALDYKNGWPLPDIAQLVAVQLSESQGDASVVGWDYNGKTVKDTHGVTPPGIAFSSYDIGLTQYNSSHNPNNPANVYDPQFISREIDPNTNIKDSLKLFRESGWRPWSSDSAIKSGDNYSAGLQAVSDTLGQAAEEQQRPNAATSSVGTVGSVTQSATVSDPNNTPSTGKAGAKMGQKLTGVGSVLQQIDQALNPNTNNTLISVPVLGSISNPVSDTAAMLQTLIVRGIFTLAFMGVTYLGIKTLTGASRSSSTNIIDITSAGIKSKLRENARVGATEQQEAIRTANAQARHQSYADSQADKYAAAASATSATANARADAATRTYDARATASTRATQKQEAARRRTIRERKKA